jgi:D-tyrosyl-tRNA(Tyr) deacylase
MKAVVQRVSSASVDVDDRRIGEIGPGLLVFVGVEQGDVPDDALYLARKIRDLRVFDGDERPAPLRFHRSVHDARRPLLVVSQFTLAADCRRGRRPSFDRAAPPDTARPLYEDLVRELRASGLLVETGEFQATMQVTLVNDGPVTLLLDSKKTEARSLKAEV